MHRRIAALNDGFSLIELVLVVAITAVFAAIAAPRYGRASGRYRLDLAARRVAADLRLAQSCAKAASSSRSVMFTGEPEQYQLSNVPALDGVVGDYTVSLSDEPYRADIATVDFNDAHQVVFSGWGLPNSGGDVTLAVGTQQKTIHVDGQTGEISIQ